MNIKPLHDRVVIKRLDDERTSAGGIVIPDTAAEKPVRGKVTAVGSGKITPDGKVLPLTVKVGDVVVFGKYAGTEIKLNSEEVVVMKEEDILGVVS